MGIGDKTKSLVASLSVAVLCASIVSSAVGESRPNVLLIVCDDLNTHVSTSGYAHISTPAFDQLASAGMTFGRAYCQYPVCGPSRASFLSGLYPESTGVPDNQSDIRETRPGTVSMPQRFKQAGYWTGSVGKVFHNTKTDPGETAWDEVLRFENDEMSQQTLAEKAACTRQTIIAMEQGKYNPSLALALKIARAFGKRIEDVFVYNEAAAP